MNNYVAEYERKLTTPQKAVEAIHNDETIVHGSSVAEPPALLTAIADRARAGELRNIKIYASLPGQYAANTVQAPDLADCICTYSWFVTQADRARVKDAPPRGKLKLSRAQDFAPLLPLCNP
jgi:itaconate CoA-transferase